MNWYTRKQWSWYGKQLGTGDFLLHNISAPERTFWDSWFAQPLSGQKDSILSNTAHRDTYNQKPWHFVIVTDHPLPEEQFFMGAMALSSDKVGRVYPFVVFLPFEKQEAILLDRMVTHFCHEGKYMNICIHQFLKGYYDLSMMDGFLDAFLKGISQSEGVSAETNVSKQIKTFLKEHQGKGSVWWQDDKVLVYNSPLDDTLFSQLFFQV